MRVDAAAALRACVAAAVQLGAALETAAEDRDRHQAYMRNVGSKYGRAETGGCPGMRKE